MMFLKLSLLLVLGPVIRIRGKIRPTALSGVCVVGWDRVEYWEENRNRKRAVT